MPRPSKIWLTTDTHFHHDAMMQLCGRPEGFEQTILSNLKYLVAEQDILIHLGDVIFYKYPDLKGMLDNIPGRKILTKGNHDRKPHGWYMRNGFDFSVDSFTLGNVIFSHKPLESLPAGVEFNVHGHFHLNEHRVTAEWYDRSIYRCLSLEKVEYKPVLLQKFLPEYRK